MKVYTSALTLYTMIHIHSRVKEYSLGAFQLEMQRI